ncbi:Zinc-finger homeodomain protein 4 [Striga hermonthica]|uniref:Zinc-finger homeodomain protein 4 n=1 Tax=Striga hermonthica TaxID=68872 RepID=A0A9N7NLD5_STRHE|nr:Zinc-finger homeodomain protein 4 [Striga hermonthica]
MSIPSRSPHGQSHGPHKSSSYAVSYAECLKNHAAAAGGTAVDGCREFMAGGREGAIESLTCAACKCHRNFHRRILLMHVEAPAAGGGREKKRFRTKFTGEQKEAMLGFAEKAEWKLSRVDEYEVRRFCEEIGVSRKVLKVWMHNNKYKFAKNKNN